MANKMIFMAAILKNKMAAITIFQNGCQQTFSKNKMASQSRGLPCVKIQIAISKLAIWKNNLSSNKAAFHSWLAIFFSKWLPSIAMMTETKGLPACFTMSLFSFFFPP